MGQIHLVSNSGKHLHSLSQENKPIYSSKRSAFVSQQIKSIYYDYANITSNIFGVDNGLAQKRRAGIILTNPDSVSMTWRGTHDILLDVFQLNLSVQRIYTF